MVSWQDCKNPYMLLGIRNEEAGLPGMDEIFRKKSVKSSRQNKRLIQKLDKPLFTNAKYGVPKGIRTPVAAVKGQCPRPLDDGDIDW